MRKNEKEIMTPHMSVVWSNPPTVNYAGTAQDLMNMAITMAATALSAICSIDEIQETNMGHFNEETKRVAIELSKAKASGELHEGPSEFNPDEVPIQ